MGVVLPKKLRDIRTQWFGRTAISAPASRTHSLHTRLVSRFGAGLLLTVSLLTGVSVFVLHQSNVRLFHLEREHSMVTFASSISPLVARFDLADIEDMLEEVRSGHHLQRIELYDYYGQRYEATHNLGAALSRTVDHSLSLRDNQDGTQVGRMKIWWGDNPAHRTALYRSLSIALLMTSLVVLLIAWMLRRALLNYVVEPVEALQQFVMTGASQGEAPIKQPDFRISELNTLASVVMQTWQQVHAESLAKQHALMRHRDELLHRVNLTDTLGRALSMADMSVWFRLSHAANVELVGRPMPAWLRGLHLTRPLGAKELKHTIQYSMKGEVQVSISRQSAAQSFSLEVSTEDEGAWSLTSVPLEAGGWALIILNTTEQHSTQRALQHAKKMESLGVMTSGVAHDFNNILAVILNAVELEQLSERGSPALDTVVKAAARGEKLVRQLLDASRKKVPKIGVVQYDNLLKNLSTVMQATLGSRYRLAMSDLAKCSVMAEEDLLETTLINLIINARDACPSGGVIKLITESVPDAERQQLQLPSDKDYVAFRVIDHGLGMRTEVQERIFDPFFTTKPKGHGTGLGLAMAYAFALRSGGVIHVESAEGSGSCFSLVLPKVSHFAQPQPDKAVQPAASAQPALLSMRVLVVDDEPSLLNTLVRFLESTGMRVSAASGVQEAKRQLQSSSLPFDMVITDMLMPDGTGADVIEALSRLARRPFTVLISGNFSADGFMLSDMGRVDVFLEKPFKLAKLKALIAEVSAAKAEKDGVSGALGVSSVVKLEDSV